MKRKKENIVFREYKSSWNFLKESRNLVYAIFFVFLVSAFAGFFITAPEQIVEQIQKFIQEILEQTKDLSYLGLARFIFLNNLQSAFVGMIFGIFLGIFPIIVAVANGYLVGYVASIGVRNETFIVLWRLVPHGIFELPAVFISLGLGLKIGTFILEDKKIKTLKEYLAASLKVFLLIVLPLLIIAAIIEGSLIYFFS